VLPMVLLVATTVFYSFYRQGYYVEFG
ncbi:hypothetical protein A2U01_0114655, partial [Trifolium medium]|nr:hypothetical protein [Trifolium medium]